MPKPNSPLRNRLLQLFAQNANKTGSYRIENASSDEAKVYIYQPIGSFYGIDPEQFARDFLAIDAKRIRLHMHTPGGDVFDARAMTSAIMASRAEVIAQIDGLVASAGTYVAMSADRIEMVKGSYMMIHNAWTLALGDHHEMRKAADLLEKISGTIADDYQARAEKAGKPLSRVEVIKMMDDETWLDAAECAEKGFADAVIDGEAMRNEWNLSAYERAPEALMNEKEEKDDEIAIAAEHRRMLERRLAMIEATA